MVEFQQLPTEALTVTFKLRESESGVSQIFVAWL